MDLCDIRVIKPLLARHGFHFSKSLGQNFLIEPQVPRQIAREGCREPDLGVLEIGPGIGPLTRELSALARRVVSVEIDRALLPILAETLADLDNVTVVQGDVLKLDLGILVDEHLSGLTPVVCANLPYQITAPVLVALIEARRFSALTVMIQREAALRLCALPGSSDYGAFSLFCQYHTRPELLFDVPPHCFLPAPKVTSSVVRLNPREAPLLPPEEEAQFFRVVKGAFAQRRKTLHNSLSAFFGSRLTRQDVADAIAACGLSPDIRGERLGLEEFFTLTRVLAQRGAFG